MTAASKTDKLLTVEEYLELEKTTGERYEYHKGRVTKRTGSTLDHSRIGGNFLVEAESNSRNKNMDYEAFSSVKLHIPSLGRFLYPDMMIVCGEVEVSKAITG